MRIVAILAARNESPYLRRCLQSLIDNGLEVYVIDNDSEDDTAEIAREFLGNGVVGIDRHPYLGSFDFVRMLQHKAEICARLDADWFMHCDADEIRQAPAPYSSLSEAVCDVDLQGYNAINFDEFVFLPTSEHEHFEGTDYVAGMRQYYFFDPKPLHRVNLWKNGDYPVDIVSSAGHSAQFPGRRIFPESFLLRHYIALSLDHLTAKYTRDRVYSPVNMERRGWHLGRARLRRDGVVLPRPDQMQTLDGDAFDRSNPLRKHLFAGPEGD
jgi:glycosyltransferase involved in cell wall biosynthesis